MKLTSPTEATSAGTERGADAADNGNANKSRIKMEQIASSENKGDARNETNGRVEERERERTKNICRSTSCSTSALCSCSFYMATSHPPCSSSCVCYERERKQTLRGLVRFWLSSIAGEHARSPSPPIAYPIAPALPPTSHLPSVLALSPLIIWAGPLFYGRETFGWRWLGVGFVCLPACPPPASTAFASLVLLGCRRHAFGTYPRRGRRSACSLPQCRLSKLLNPSCCSAQTGEYLLALSTFRIQRN